MEYSVANYGSMIAEPARTRAYAAALRCAISPGAVVVDVGTGTGLFALLACQYGARKVYAIEADAVIQLAQETAAENGLRDRVEFLQGDSRDLCLPEPADVLVADLRGVLPLFGHHLPSIIDARRRFLSPGGVLINQSDSLWAAPVAAPDLYATCDGPWSERPFGFTMQSSRHRAVNTFYRCALAPHQCLAPPRKWAEIAYTTATESNVRGVMEWQRLAACTGHGLGLWFEAELFGGNSFTTAPSSKETVYGNLFLPWEQPVHFREGDHVRVAIRADLVGNDYIWGWQTDVYAEGEEEHPRATFRQSSFAGHLLSAEKRGARYVPSLNERGHVDLLILSSMKDRIPLGEIAARILRRFPDRFADQQDALTHIGRLAGSYC